MSDRDANIAYLKRLKTHYELRAKNLKLQEIAARYRRDVFKTVPPNLYRYHPYYRRYHNPVSPGFDGDNCPCNADLGYSKLGSSQPEDDTELSDAHETDQSDSGKETDEYSTSLKSLDLARLSSIKQLAQWENDTKRRIARLNEVEKVVLSLMAGKPPLNNNGDQATVGRVLVSNSDADIRSDVERMKDLVNNVALKVKVPESEEQGDVTHSEIMPPRCQPECPLEELTKNLEDGAQYVNDTMAAITSSLASTKLIISKQETELGATEKKTLDEVIGDADVSEPIAQHEPKKENSKMEIIRRSIDLVVDHLKACAQCPVEEFENINHDLEDILEIFLSMHNAGDTLDEETEEIWEDAVSEREGTATNITDEIIAEVSMQQLKQFGSEESSLLKDNRLGENLSGKSANITESYDENDQEPVNTKLTAAHTKTNCGCHSNGSNPTQRMLLVDPIVENEVEGERRVVGAPVETVLTGGESVSCQTVISFSARSNVNVTAICLKSVGLCATVAKDKDNLKNVCKCEKIEKVHAIVPMKPESASIEPSPEPAAIESFPDQLLAEPASKEPLTEPTPKEPLLQVPAPSEVLREITFLEPSRQPSPPTPMAEQATPVELLAAQNNRDVLAESNPANPSVATPIEASPKEAFVAVQEPVEEAVSSNLPLTTAIEPATIGSTMASSKGVDKLPDPERSPMKVTSSEKPSKLPDPVRSPAKSASTPIAVKLSRERSPMKRFPSPTIAKINRERSPMKRVLSPTVAKINREKGPLKIESPPIAAMVNGEKSPVKGVSSPISVNKPQEKIAVKAVASPIAATADRKKGPVKSTASPISMKPIAANVPEESGSTSSAAKPTNRQHSPEKISPKVSLVKPVVPKVNAVKRPSTPSTYKIRRPSIGSVGSRSTARSAFSKKRDSLNLGSKGDAPIGKCVCISERLCAGKTRKESPCQKPDTNRDLAAGMCPSSPQRKCECRQPLSRRDCPVKRMVPNNDATAEGLHIQSPRRCFCSQWQRCRESLAKARGTQGGKEQVNPQVVKKTISKCKQKKQK